MDTQVKTIRALHTANGRSVWKFCTTSDGCYLARKNGWNDVKSFKSWNQMLWQYNRWLEYTNHTGDKTFIAGYPRKSEATTDTISHKSTNFTEVPPMIESFDTNASRTNDEFDVSADSEDLLV